MKYFFFASALFIAIPSFAQATSETNTEKYFATIQNSPAALEKFLYAMPKGGDLHNHPGGATYAENLLRYAADDQYCVDRASMVVTTNSDCARNDLLNNAIQDVQFKDTLIDAWSMQHFKSGTESGHDHFFSAFKKFDVISKNHPAQVLAEIAERAGTQNENYLELMITLDGSASRNLGKELGWNTDFSAMREKLLANGMNEIVTGISKNLDTSEAAMRNLLSCQSAQPKAGCQVKISYLYQVLREQAPESVFAQLLAGFESASHDSRVVGINMVQPEDGKISMRDYDLHMQMIGYLHRLYPNVHVSLHAGELNPNLVPAEGLKFHINDAVYIAGANRIGHGDDITQENNAEQLLNYMASNQILVEINLTSNAYILNIEGSNHPLPLYIKSNVPVTLSTDDEGIARSNLTKEYMRAVTNYHYDYLTLKKFARNSLYYSFLNGKNLWSDATYTQVALPCAGNAFSTKLISSACSAYLNDNAKASAQWELEKRFAVFERSFN